MIHTLRHVEGNIGNYTWGKRLTNLVDKANAKPIVEAMNIKGLKIPKTYAI